MLYLRKILLGFLCISSAAVLADFHVALVLDKGGKDDKSFNAAAYQGAQKAQKEGYF